MIDNFVPLWSSVVDSTLWEEAPNVRLTFLTMLVLKGPDQVVRMPFRRLVKKVNLAAEQVEAALEVLKAPDVRGGEEQAFEGRRIEEVRENGLVVGWLILNGEHYQLQMGKLMARMRKTELQRERRRAKANGSLSGKARSNERAVIAAEERGDTRTADALLNEVLPEAVPQPMEPAPGDEAF